MTEHSIKAIYRREHVERPEIIRTLAGVDAMIDALLSDAEGGNLAQVFSLQRPLMPAGVPDHELLAGVDEERMIGVLAFMDDGNWVPVGSDGRGDDVIYSLAGWPREFPDRSEVSIDLVRQAVKEFLVSGGQRPTCVQWQVPEFW